MFAPHPSNFIPPKKPQSSLKSVRVCNVWAYPHIHSHFHPLFCKSPAVDCRRDCQVYSRCACMNLSHGSRAVLSITSSSRARKDSNRGHRSSPARSAGAGENSNPGSRSGGKSSVRHVGQLLGDFSPFDVSHFTMQSFPKMCPHGSSTGCSCKG